jgi:hypothetical protein
VFFVLHPLRYFAAGARFFRFLTAIGLGLTFFKMAVPRSRLINSRDLARSASRHSELSSRFLAIRAAARWFSRLRWQSLHLVECKPFVLAGFPQSTQMNLYSRLMINSLDWAKTFCLWLAEKATRLAKRPSPFPHEGPSQILPRSEVSIKMTAIDNPGCVPSEVHQISLCPLAVGYVSQPFAQISAQTSVLAQREK